MEGFEDSGRTNVSMVGATANASVELPVPEEDVANSLVLHVDERPDPVVIRDLVHSRVASVF